MGAGPFSSSPDIAGRRPEPIAAAPQRAAPIRCLLIDDSKYDREQMRLIMRQTQLAVDFIEADSLNAALEALRAGSFGVILLDQTLPDGDGTTAAALLAQHLGTELPPVIMVTGSDEAALPARAIAAGCVDFICKDKVTIPRLEKAIREAVARRNLTGGGLTPAGARPAVPDDRAGSREALARLGRQAAKAAEQQAAAARELARLEAMLDELRREVDAPG